MYRNEELIFPDNSGTSFEKEYLEHLKLTLHQKTSRIAVLESIEQKLFKEGQEAIRKCAIWGLGGVGKTQIVLELIHRLRKRSPDCLIFWLRAADAENLQKGFRDMAKKLQIPELQGNENKSDVKELVRNYLSQESAGKWLLVFDELDDLTKHGSIDQFKVDLPKSSHGYIVFTTRDKSTAHALSATSKKEVKAMDEVEARVLLRKYTQIQNEEAVGDETALLEELTYLPLAIVQAGSYINRNSKKLSDYLKILRSREEEAIKILGKNFNDDCDHSYGRDVTKHPVASTWLISFDQIRVQTPLAAKHLAFMACVDAKGIPRSLLPSSDNIEDDAEAIDTLTCYSFITQRSGHEEFDLHRLVHLAMRNWLGKENELHAQEATVLERVDEIFPAPSATTEAHRAQYQRHAEYILTSTQGRESRSLHWGTLADSLGHYYYDIMQFTQSRYWYQQSLNSVSAGFGTKHLFTLQVELKLVDILLYIKLNLDAAERLQRMLADQGQTPDEPHLIMLRRIHGDSGDPPTRSYILMLDIMRALGSTYMSLKKYDKAEAMLRRTTTLCQEKLGVLHEETLWAVMDLARLFNDQHKYEDAEVMCRNIINNSSQVIADQSLPRVLCCVLREYAVALKGQEKYVEAEVQQRRLVEFGAEPSSRLSNTWLAMWKGDHAFMLNRLGNHEEAELLLRQVKEQYVKSLGIEHERTLATSTDLATTLIRQGKHVEAESEIREVIQVAEAEPRESQILVARAFWCLADILAEQNRCDEAVEYYAKASAGYTSHLGSEHPEAKECAEDLIRCSRELKRMQGRAILGAFQRFGKSTGRNSEISYVDHNN